MNAFSTGPLGIGMSLVVGGATAAASPPANGIVTEDGELQTTEDGEVTVTES